MSTFSWFRRVRARFSRPMSELRAARRAARRAEARFTVKAALYDDYANVSWRDLKPEQLELYRQTVAHHHAGREAAYFDVKTARAEVKRIEADYANARRSQSRVSF